MLLLSSVAVSSLLSYNHTIHVHKGNTYSITFDAFSVDGQVIYYDGGEKMVYELRAMGKKPHHKFKLDFGEAYRDATIIYTRTNDKPHQISYHVVVENEHENH